MRVPHMKKLPVAALFAVLCSVCCIHPASAASFEELTPFFSVQHFDWSEYFGGKRLLKEEGELYSAGVVLGSVTDASLTLRLKEELFGGVIGYNGETQGANPIPVRTDVNYFGNRQDFDLGYRLPADYLRLEPFAGVGYRWWLRDLQNSTTASGQTVSGYTETWQTAYCRLGARGRYQNDAGWSVFAEGGAKYPFYTGNSVDFAGVGTTTFHPGGRWSAFAEGGITYRRFKLALSYEGFRFSQSPIKTVGTQGFFQPDSSSDLLGVSLGWNFR